MLPIKKENKELTEQQQSFISALFGEAQGNPKKATELAGGIVKLCAELLLITIKALQSSIVAVYDAPVFAVGTCVACKYCG